VCIADDGNGMTAETQKRTLDPFFSTARGHDHPGLGLPIAFGPVTSLRGGRISADSAPGTGTVVTLELPRTAA
jgi:signal transduction histidine kinase